MDILELLKERIPELLKPFAGHVYSKARLMRRRIQYNYYLKNWIECKRNRELLENVRYNFKDKIVNKNPLVSVLIATYNRGKILTERAIPSVLRQTYQNFEIIIVGDHCTDNTEELLKKFNDERIKFYNLPKRGNYPKNPFDRWLVAGVEPRNKCLELCSGDWIAPLDDDDEFTEDHIETLLNFAMDGNYEMVYGMVKMEVEPGKWIYIGSYPPERGKICHLSVLYHSSLKFFKYDINSWKYGEPADWNLWRRMKEAGVRIGFVNKVIGKHYLERMQMGIWERVYEKGEK
jgi:glycosyltransferase involved in cell wall biosynthesis